MATTSPDNIWTPDSGDDYALTTDLAATADTVQDALNSVRAIEGTTVVTDATDRATKFPTPIQGQRVFRNDKGWTETYFAAYNSVSNPGGATPAGWYPTAGPLPHLLLSGAGSLSIASGSFVSLNPAAGSPTIEVNDGFTVGTNIAVPYPGLYDITVSMRFGSSSAGVLRAIRAEVGGTVFGRSDIRGAISSSGTINLNLAATVSTATNFQITGFQDTGGSLTSVIDNLSVRYVRPRR